MSRAVKFHQKEEKLLNEIGTDLKAFWDEADQSKHYVVLGDQDQEAAKSQTDSKDAAKAKTKAETKDKATDATQSKTQKDATAPKTDSFIELDDSKFLQISSDNDAEAEDESVHKHKDHAAKKPKS